MTAAGVGSAVPADGSVEPLGKAADVVGSTGPVAGAVPGRKTDPNRSRRRSRSASWPTPEDARIAVLPRVSPRAMPAPAAAADEWMRRMAARRWRGAEKILSEW